MCKGWLIINKDYLPKSKNFNEKQVKKADYSYKVLSDGVETKSEIFCVENIIFCHFLLCK